jgi:predicted flap endonuclease-1-like 5' DNA nuclease/chromosome segregation ATPase
MAAAGMTPGNGVVGDGASVEELRRELAKWQERVPRLAGALRERTSEVEALRAQLTARESQADPASPGTGSGIQARDDLIKELESKIRALSGKYQDTEGQLRARDLEISQLREEASEWREKWQAATNALDEQADGVEGKTRELKRVKAELDELLALQDTHTGRIKEQELELTALRERSRSLEARNENLFETTELANRQIETLGENLEHLRSELKASKQALADLQASGEGSGRRVDELKAQIASRDQDIEFLHSHVEEKQSEIKRLGERIAGLEPLEGTLEAARAEQERLTRELESRNAEVAGLTERLAELDGARRALADAEQQQRSIAGELEAARQESATLTGEVEKRQARIGELGEEVARLEECVVRAEDATGRFEAERRQLSEQMDELKRRNEHLEAQLTERSSLVVGLEQEKTAISSKSTSLEAENKRLSEALDKAQRAAAGNADYIAQVDARLERQKQHMDSLETELAEIQEEYAEAVKTHQRELKERDARMATVSAQLADADPEALKATLARVEGELDEARQAQDEDRRRLEVQEAKGRDLSRDLERAREAENEARRSLGEQTEKLEKLEKQLHKQSTAALEAENAAARLQTELEELRAATSREPDEVSGENALLQAEVIKLEGMVRERTEQLNKLRWQQDMLEKQAGDPSESKMLVVLNQQLQSARDENRRLKDVARELEERIRGLEREAEAPVAGPSEETVRDDLSCIRGIGPKLVKQLTRLGITRYDQIATLSESDLDDPEHPLHAMKGRVIKDDWIAQAARLAGA